MMNEKLNISTENQNYNSKWLIWGVMALAFFFCYFHRYALSVISNELTLEYNLSQVQLGMLASMYFYAYSLMQIPVGIMCDKYGPGIVVSVGLIVAALGSIGFAFSQTLVVAYMCRFVVGGGLATAFVSIFKAQSVLFDKKEIPLMTGLTNTVGNVGALVATVPLAFLVVYIGWRNMFLVLGLLTIVLAGYIYYIAVRRNDIHQQKNESISIREGVISTFLNIDTYPPLIVLFFVGGSLFSFTSIWGMQYVMNIYNISNIDASGYIMMLTAGVVVGGPLVGYSAKHINPRRVMLFGTIVYSMIWVSIIVLWNGNIPMVLAKPIMFLMGFSAMSVLITFSILKDSNKLKYVGIVTSIGNMAPTFSTTVFNSIVGNRLTEVWSGQVLDGKPIYTVDEFKSALLVYLICSIIGVIFSGVILIRNK